MMRRVAVVGDRLSTGGHIDHYKGPICTWGNCGHQVALIGGSAYCEACGSTGVIAKAGGPRRINFMGETAADGDTVLCNCPTPPRIVAELAGESWCDDEAEACATREAKRAIDAAPTGKNAATLCDEQFTLSDRTGRVLRDTYYTLRLPSGELLHGVTNSIGRTTRYRTDGAQRLAVYLGHREG